MKLKLIGIGLLIALFSVVIYTQIYKPVIIQPKKVEGSLWDLAYEAELALAEDVQSGEYDKNTVSIHAFNGNLPSENPNDYMNVYCTLSIGNRSVFNIYPIKAVVYELGDYKENVLFSLSSDAAVPGRAWRFSNSEVTFQLDVNVANMDESAIKDLVKGIKAKVIYKGDFIGVREQIIDFSECEDVTISLEEKI